MAGESVAADDNVSSDAEKTEIPGLSDNAPRQIHGLEVCDRPSITDLLPVLTLARGTSICLL